MWLVCYWGCSWSSYLVLGFVQAQFPRCSLSLSVISCVQVVEPISCLHNFFNFRFFTLVNIGYGVGTIEIFGIRRCSHISRQGSMFVRSAFRYSHFLTLILLLAWSMLFWWQCRSRISNTLWFASLIIVFVLAEMFLIFFWAVKGF